MTEERAILNAIKQHPYEDTPRLVYSDWLEENGRPEQAEYIRKYRVGKTVGAMRSYAKTVSGSAHRGSTVYGRGFATPNIRRYSAEAHTASQREEHDKAAEAHDKVGALHYSLARSIMEAGPETHRVSDHLRWAANHYRAAHFNEAVGSDLGGEAHRLSVRAYDLSENAGTGNAIQARASLTDAANMHREAAKLHEKEGNTDTASRHRTMAALHNREASMWATPAEYNSLRNQGLV